MTANATLSFNLEHVLLGIKITYEPFLTPFETDQLLDSARAFFTSRPWRGRSFHICLAEAFMRRLDGLSSHNSPEEFEEICQAWPLLSALAGSVQLSPDTNRSPPAFGSEELPAGPFLRFGQTTPDTTFESITERESALDTEPPAYSKASNSKPKLKGRITPLLTSTSQGFVFGTGREEEVTAQARLVQLEKHEGRMCLLVTIGGRDLVVLPGGRVLVEQRFGEAQEFDLGERLPPTLAAEPAATPTSTASSVPDVIPFSSLTRAFLSS